MQSTTSPGGNDLVSIVMPAYNAERYLAAAVESVLAQTYPVWELLIVDDASTDETLAIAEGFHHLDKRIRVFTQPDNSGVARSRNTALNHAKGKYIAFLDSDDLWVPDKLEKQIAFMLSNKVTVSYGAYRRMDELGKCLGSVWPVKELDYTRLLRSNFIGNLTGMYDAEILGKQYFGELRHEDYVAWLALVKRAGIARSVDEELGSYRVYTGSASSNKIRAAFWQWQIYRKSELLGIPQSCWLMLQYFYHGINKRI